MLSGLDLGILAVYLVLVMVLGLWARRRASGSIEDYFLGGRHIPWYILGLSGMAAFLDMSGTMLQTSFFYMLGAKGYWIAWRGAVALMLAFFMIFMAKWLARSRVMTIAELIALRFGADRQGQLARFLAAASALIISITMIAYFFIGAGKFFHQYFPMLSPNAIAICIFVIVMIYTTTSGFWGVVITDIFQGILMVVVTAFITWQAMSRGHAGVLHPAYTGGLAHTDSHDVVHRDARGLRFARDARGPDPVLARAQRDAGLRQPARCPERPALLRRQERAGRRAHGDAVDPAYERSLPAHDGDGRAGRQYRRPDRRAGDGPAGRHPALPAQRHKGPLHRRAARRVHVHGRGARQLLRRILRSRYLPAVHPAQKPHNDS
jgi:hypothetical protein